MNSPSPADWCEVLLDDVADEVTVGYVGSMTQEYIEKGIPWLRSKNVEPFNIDWNDMKYVSEDFHRKLSKSALRPGDVVIVRTGKPGAAALIPDSLAVANCSDLVIVRCGKKLDKRFCVYYLNSAAKHHIHSHLVGAVQQHFNVGAAKKLKINLPPIEEQRAIASILGALDDKIELNRRMNATLESLARAIFKSWFVDFDPVKINAGQMPADFYDPTLLSLFPSTFQDSELGPIPEGWEITTIDEVVESVGGATPSTKKSEFWEGGTLPWATPKDLSGLQAPILVETDRRITELGAGKISSGMLPAGTVLMSSRAPVGYLAIATMPVAINQGFIAIKPNERVSQFFMLNWCQENMDRIKGRAGGTTFPEISKKNFRPMKICVPPANLVQAFTDLVRPVYDSIAEQVNESRTLSQQRDVLLPQLLSGKLPVVLEEMNV